MKLRSFVRYALFLALIALTLMTDMGAASAQLLVYEPFDYRPINDAVYGRLEGRNGGLGFAGPWVDSEGAPGWSPNGYGFIYDQRGNPEELYGGKVGQGKLTWDGKVDNLPTMGGYVGNSDWNTVSDRMNASRKLARSAGEMAKASGGELWISAVWHFPNQSFFAPVSIGLTTNDGQIKDRAYNVSNNGDGLGIGNGIKDLNNGKKKKLNVIHWKQGKEETYAAVDELSKDKDNIVILKYQFGETDKLSVWHFTEDQEMTEEAFNQNAVTIEADIDEFALDTLTFACIHYENAVDEFRIANDFKSVITGKIKPRNEVKLLSTTYDAKSDRYTLAWSSNPGEVYGVYIDEDAGGYQPCVSSMVKATQDGDETTFGPFANPRPGDKNLKFAIGLPDVVEPVMDRAWGAGNTISLHFSEAMLPTTALDVKNYKVIGSDGERVALSSATFAPGNQSVQLTTAEPLALNTSYSVTVSNLTDRANLSLTNSEISLHTWDDDPNGVKVFVLAGQSNMLGRGWYDKGQGDVIGGVGSLRERTIKSPDEYGHLVDADGNWREIESVKVCWRRERINAMRVGIGSGPDCIGPEYGFAWALRDHFKDEPVLIVKIAWGGKSLHGDFCSPSAAARRDGRIGPYYIMLMDEIRSALDKIGEDFPALKGKGYQFAGFGWHQGYNDMINPIADRAYEQNMTDFINDIRDEFGKPKLPFSIATTGHGGMSVTTEQRLTLAGQLAVADPKKHPEFAGNVFTVDSRPFQRTVEESPRSDGAHWNYNGDTLYLIGKGMGDGMVQMLRNK